MAAFFVRIAPVEAPGDPVLELESIVPQLHGVIDVDVGVGRKVPMAQKLKGPTWRIPRSPNASNGDLLFSNTPTAELLLRTLDSVRSTPYVIDLTPIGVGEDKQIKAVFGPTRVELVI